MSMDPDHLDIYGARNEMLEGFNRFIRQITENGTLILPSILSEKLSKLTIEKLESDNIKIITFGSEGDAIVANIRVEQGQFVFDLELEDRCICGLVSKMPGRHNIENATAAILASKALGLSDEELRAGLESFKGISRRFEKVIEKNGIAYIDDYAHHPTELRSAIGAAKELFPDRKILGIFQPHLYSRTRDFADGFAEELDKLNEILLMDIYPARELPIKGVDSEMIFERMKNKNKELVTKESLMKTLKEKEIDVIMTLGAGDIDVFVPKIKEWLQNKK